MNKIFAVGDIHGCVEMLRRLMRMIAADLARDTLVFIGDYIDRSRGGPQVIDDLRALREESRNVICLRGNHEAMLQNYLDGVEEDLYLANGGAATLAAYGIAPADSPREKKEKIPAAHRRFLESLLPCYETQDFIFVHAGLRPGIALGEQSVEDLLWIRRDFIDSDYDFGKRVVFGHTPRGEPLVDAGKIGIDTGAVYGGRLTAVELPAVIFYQVES
ncbi:MAG: serine/threonine protein phosphatase [Deltaproteobacteria bacterium]|jgi:serine/threonine protein phosphatase 1|nr:serine/threonine protein phosphatase [Syntrophaceae bacterium]